VATAAALWLLLAAAHAPAAPCASTDACLRMLEAAQRDLHSFTADFEQVKHVSLLDEPLTSSGRFSFTRPDRITLRIDQPQPATVIINGKDVQIPNLPEQERQAMAMVPVADMFTRLGAILSGSARALQDGFDVTAAADPEGHDTIRMHLVPRLDAWKRMFRGIDVVFAGSDLVPQAIRIEDGFGDRLEITLRNVQRN